MATRVRELGTIAIVDIDGKIDINSSDIIEAVAWLTNAGKTKIILNFESVSLVDYSGLSVLAIAYKNIVNHGGVLKLLNIPTSLTELFRIVKLDTTFEMYTSEEEAIESFSRSDLETLRLRRRFTRLDINLTATYSIAGDGKRPKIFEGKILNISAAGLYIYTPYTFVVGTPLELAVTLHDEANSFETTGKVIWLADKEIQPHCFPGMGAAFVHLSPEKERMVIEFIDKNITWRSEPL